MVEIRPAPGKISSKRVSKWENASMDGTESDTCKCPAQHLPLARMWEWYPALHFLPHILKLPQQVCSGSSHRSGLPWIKFGFHLLLIYSEQNTILTGSLTSPPRCKKSYLHSWNNPSTMAEASGLDAERITKHQEPAKSSFIFTFFISSNCRTVQYWILQSTTPAPLSSLTQKQPPLGLWNILCLLGWVFLLFSRRKD